MAEPLSIASSVVGIISLGIQVSQSLVEYYTAYRTQDIDIERTGHKLDTLLVILESISKVAKQRTFRAGEEKLVQQIESSIVNCEEVIGELQEELSKFDKNSVRGLRAAGHRLAYPFRKSTLHRLDEDIDDIRRNLSLAIDVLHINDNSNAAIDIQDVKHLLTLVRVSQLSTDIRKWLHAPDVTVNHNEACAKRHPSTGNWLVKSIEFRTWLEKSNSFLWINGFAGCGKSVLCSTAIQHVFRHRRSDPSIGIAFFYFAFNDISKQDLSSMLRALIFQLSNQSNEGNVDLARLYDRYRNGTPPMQELLETLRILLRKFQDVYIIVDALDESPRGVTRDAVLQSLTQFHAWSIDGLHTLVTSRDLPDIRENIQNIGELISMKNAGVDQDIANFISSHLQESLALRKWSQFHDQIRDALTIKAKGVFRWVECQFKSLAQCPRSEAALEERLASLPESLDEAYERMLLDIHPELIEQARRLLALLCFAERPLAIEEIIDCLAVELGETPNFNLKRRLQDEDDLSIICPGLFNVITQQSSPYEINAPGKIVQIAHFSVQEYLKSDRIRRGRASVFSIEPNVIHNELVQICLVYLVDPYFSKEVVMKAALKDRAFVEYAAQCWYKHYRKAKQRSSKVEQSALELFTGDETVFMNWSMVYDMGTWTGSLSFTTSPPLHYASYLGLTPVMLGLLERGADPAAHNEGYGNALQVAASGGSKAAIQLLLDKDVDINAQGGVCGNALQAASLEGYFELVQLLRDRGAYINAQGGVYGNALQAASSEGHFELVQLLLDRGAYINAQGGKYGNALQAASLEGHFELVQLLLDRGADVNAQGGRFGSALQAASFRGKTEIVELLLKQGADVNARGGEYGNALRAASYRSDSVIVQQLLDSGANINAVGRDSNALEIAVKWKRNLLVQLLLENGANMLEAEYAKFRSSGSRMIDLSDFWTDRG